MSYTNADGLYILTDGGAGVAGTTGQTVVGVRKALVVKINDATAIGTSAAAPAANDAFIPANAVIVDSHLIVDTAWTSGGSATLGIGLYTAAGATIDVDGIDATIAVATLAADAVVPNDGALADGTQNVGAADAYVGTLYATAAFTAGSATLVIEYIEAI
jgi:hypothetical protein